METKDVKSILNIPNIEDYLQEDFHLVLYEVGDKTIIYESDWGFDGEHTISIDIISDETLIEGFLDLAEIIVHYDDVSYFKFIIRDQDEQVVQSHHYRPCIEESEKQH